MKNKEKGSLRNYLILSLIVFATLVVTFYVLNWYKQYNESKLSESIIKEVLTEIKYNDLGNVLKERDFLVIYTCTSSETKCRNFEKKFKKFVIENNLTDDIVYFNLGYDSKAADEGGLLNKVYQKYKHEDLIKKVNNYPTILVFSEGKIIDLLSPNKDSKVSISSVREFLEGYELNS